MICEDIENGVGDSESTSDQSDVSSFDPLKNLNDDEMELFKTFKHKLKDLNLDDREREWIDDTLILRYLRAREYQLDAAFDLFKGTLAWRKSYKPHEITAESLSHEASTGKQYVLGKSLGRSVIYMRPVRENTKNYDKQIQLLVYNIERAISYMDQHKGHEQIVLVIDFNNYSIFNAPPMSVSKQTLDILSHHYPERLGNAFLIDTPFIFNVFWKAIHPFINKCTAKKIIFVNGEKQKKKILPQYFSMDELEEDVGGNLSFKYNHQNFWKNEIELNRKERKLPPLSENEMNDILNAKS
eukprot:gene9069-11107_t